MTWRAVAGRPCCQHGERRAPPAHLAVKDAHPLQRVRQGPRGRGVSENKHSADVESPPPRPCWPHVCMCVHPEGESRSISVDPAPRPGSSPGPGTGGSGHGYILQQHCVLTDGDCLFSMTLLRGAAGGGDGDPRGGWRRAGALQVQHPRQGGYCEQALDQFESPPPSACLYAHSP
jgi:hypothetical protein